MPSAEHLMATSAMSGGLVTGVSASSQGRHSKISTRNSFLDMFSAGGGGHMRMYLW